MKTHRSKKVSEFASGPTLSDTGLGRLIRQSMADRKTRGGSSSQASAAKLSAPLKANHVAVTVQRHPLEDQAEFRHYGCLPEAQDATVPGPTPQKRPSRRSDPAAVNPMTVASSPGIAEAPTMQASSLPSGDAQSAVSREMRRVLEIDLSRPALLRLADVLRLYRVSRSTWYAGIKSGLYEPGIPIGPRCVAWRSEYILSLLANPPKFVRA